MNEISLANFDEIMLIALAGTLGQIIIYITINRFDCFLLSIVNTSRKFFSILFSILYFNHALSLMHWAGIVLVIGSIVMDVVLSQRERTNKRKQKKE